MSHMFSYSASALGVGGVVHLNGKRTVIPSQASVALAPGGGEGHAFQSNYSKAGVSFDSAESHVVGFDDGRDAFTTYTDVLVTGLNLFNQLRIGLMRATVESRHTNAGTSFKLQVTYRDVQIDGFTVVPELDADLEQCDTFDKYERQLRADPNSYESRFGLPPGKLVQTLDNTSNPHLRGSLLKDLKIYPVTEAARQRGALGRREGYGVSVPKLGRVHFAEYHVKPGRRRLTLLRIDVGRGQTFAPFQPNTSEMPNVQAFDVDLQRVAPLADENAAAFVPMAAQPLALMSGTSTSDGTVSVASVEGNGSPPWKP